MKLQEYKISATRTTVYRVRATSKDDAMDRMMSGTAEEVDGTTHDIQVEHIPDKQTTERPRRRARRRVLLAEVTP